MDSGTAHEIAGPVSRTGQQDLVTAEAGGPFLAGTEGRP